MGGNGGRCAGVAWLQRRRRRLERRRRRRVGMISVRFLMKRSAKVPTSPPATRTAMLYTMGKPKKAKVVLPVSTPAELRRSLNLSRTALRRVERAIAKAGVRRKAG